MRTPGLACDPSTLYRNDGPDSKVPTAAGSACKIRVRFGPMRRDVALRWRTRRVGVATSVHDSILARSSTRFKPLMR